MSCRETGAPFGDPHASCRGKPKKGRTLITIRCSSTGSGAIYSVETLCDHKLNQETAAGWCDALAFLDDRSKSLLSRSEASLLLNFCEFRLPWFGMRQMVAPW